jgi:hypothetical protein
MSEITIKELMEMCYEHLGDVTGWLYVKTVEDTDTAHKSYTWMDHVIWTAFSGGKFYETIDSTHISGKLMIQVIEYCSDYHKQRELDNGSLTKGATPEWIERYMTRQVVVMQGHTLDSILDLFGEAVCYMNREEAYTQILLVVNNHLELRSFTDRAEADMVADPLFRNWVHNHMNFTPPVSIEDIPPPPRLQRQTCDPIPSTFQKYVDDEVSYEDFREKYLLYVLERPQRLAEVSEVLDARDDIVFTPETVVDVFGWGKEDLEYFIDMHYKVEQPLRRSTRMKRKRED